MTTSRKFAAFSKSTAPDFPSFRMREIPDGGFCLSSFVVINSKENPEKVLLGHLNPSAPWDHIGALDEKRVLTHSKGWMIPSSHLIIHESPHEASKRVLKEQLGIENEKVALSDPKVVSEAYTLKLANLPNHWDIGFIYRGTLSGNAPKSNAWTDLRFIDVGKASRSEMARSHEDILEYAGFRFRDS